MMKGSNQLTVREAEPDDFKFIVDYFLPAEKEFLEGMGVDASKLPERENWLGILGAEFRVPADRKKFYFIIWLMDGNPVGHCNINKIIFGEEAYVHLHVWASEKRKKGMGMEFLRLSIPVFFKVFELKNLYCEPYALNPAPNRTLKKLGFDFIKQYETVPGLFNFPQMVNRWQMSFTKYQS